VLPLRTVSKAFTREVSLTDSPAYEGAGLGRADERARQALAEMLERNHCMREQGLIKPRMTPEQRDRELRLIGVLHAADIRRAAHGRPPRAAAGLGG